MKRSQINAIMQDAITFIKKQNFALPPFAYWTPQQWEEKGHEYDEIRDTMLGWDITDFGSGDFEKVGLFMFTIRNGSYAKPQYPKPYCEKLLIVKEGQVTPYHFHWKKQEDIINRGGGVLLVKVFGSTPEETLSEEPLTVCVDGRNYEVPAGTIIRLEQGESITLYSGQYHSFWGEEGKGTVLVGEVSCVNDDTADNRFLEKTGRFPAVEEDVPALYPLFSEIPAAKD